MVNHHQYEECGYPHCCKVAYCAFNMIHRTLSDVSVIVAFSNETDRLEYEYTLGNEQNANHNEWISTVSSVMNGML